ncbi:Nucleolar [Macleaya cordata]|uniref:Nucleolar n=1 Tax=Macleaya cordata TaxID=56857 RepID=A0A200PRS4_MACCD|nr:Nucleolar [Macleaya cordata]
MAGGALAAGSSLAKHLASCNKSTRDKAIKLLKTWLPSQTTVPDEEMKKIWKGLFYCMWHADKQPVQMELINRLSSLLVNLDLSLSIQYFEVFLITMRREWSGIDYLRLDKFYLLNRKFLHQFFNLLKKNSWDLELCSRLMSVLEEKTLFSDDNYPAQGVNYHISEVFMEELKPFLPISLETVGVLLKPFLTVMVKSSDKVLLNKIKSSMFDFLLRNGKKLLETKKSGDCNENVDDEVELFGTIALKFGLSTKLFDLGSSSDCLQGNRKVLFGLHEEFLKLEKDLASSGVEISVPKVKDEVNEDEVPDLVPIPEMEVNANEVLVEQVEVDPQISNGSADKPSKKKGKKAKKASDETKKSKKNKKGLSDNGVSEVKDENENGNIANGENSKNDVALVNLDESVISNLQMQFERVAAEVGMDLIDSDLPTLPFSGTVSKKRKRARSMERKGSRSSDQGVVGGNATEKSGEKSAKKVRFSMKNNLVWKPHSPLPPQSLRLPPSATPRGSALKQGLSPGPIRENSLVPKKAKQRANAAKKARKGPKGVAPAVKRLRKLRSL